MTNHQNYPILDFDPTLPAIIEPAQVFPRRDVPRHLVICYFKEVIAKVVAVHQPKVIFEDRSEDGNTPIYEISYQGQRLAFCQGRVGAPIAVGIMEEAIAIGVEFIMVCGGSGVLNPDLAVGHILVPRWAYRDEGSSYHYLPPSDKVEMNPAALSAILTTLDEKRVPYLVTSTWTTDALFRETPDLAAKYRALGCACVEMEAAALMAAAQFRGIVFGQIVYGGDVVIDSGWDKRGWHTRTDIRENLFWLTADACLKLGMEEQHA